MIHFNCFQPKHTATYVVGARKTVSRDFSFEHPKYKGSVACRSAFFLKKTAFRAGKLGCEDYLRFDSTGTRMMIKNIWNIGKKKSASAGYRLTITL